VGARHGRADESGGMAAALHNHVMVTLLCTVRECHLPLALQDRRMLCERGHSFDIARSGYINLLQPQDRRSPVPGDSQEAVAARRRFLERYGQPMLEAIRAFLPKTDGPILDVGCGEGYHLDALRSTNEAHGIDISVAAIDAAARRYSSCTWVVANADRFLPYASQSFALAMSITARMNPEEFRRVLRDGGALMIAIPGPDDLVELRGMTRDRVERTVEAFAPHFTLVKHERARHVAMMDAEAVKDLVTSTYRRVKARGDTEVTMSRDLLLFSCSSS
jgi:23S rRNA (guanine745-N1)-methyltransferase